VDPFLTVTIFFLGLAFGSFLNVCVYRLPLGKSVVAPRSACPHCGKFIPLYDNLPVVSWLLLRGKLPANAVKYLSGEKFELTSDTPAAFELDGEWIGKLPVTFAIEREKLRVVVP